MKKLCCIVLCVVLVFALAGVAFAIDPPNAGMTPINYSPTTSDNGLLYQVAEYDTSAPQSAIFNDYLTNNGYSNWTVEKVIDLQIYSEQDQVWDTAADIVGEGPFTFSLGSGYPMVLHSSSMSGGVEELGNSSSITTSTGFGLFALVTIKGPEGSPISCTNLPSGEQLYKYGEYGPGTPQYDMLKEYMDKNGISGTLDHVWALSVWDEHLQTWIPNNVFAEGSYTISMEAGYTVLHNSSLSGGTENLDSSASFTTTTGFGLFGFVKPESQTQQTATKSPKTTDNTGNPAGWLILAAGLCIALVAVKKCEWKSQK